MRQLIKATEAVLLQTGNIRIKTENGALIEVSPMYYGSVELRFGVIMCYLWRFATAEDVITIVPANSDTTEMLARFLVNHRYLVGNTPLHISEYRQVCGFKTEVSASISGKTHVIADELKLDTRDRLIHYRGTTVINCEEVAIDGRIAPNGTKIKIKQLQEHIYSCIQLEDASTSLLLQIDSEQTWNALVEKLPRYFGVHMDALLAKAGESVVALTADLITKPTVVDFDYASAPVSTTERNADLYALSDWLWAYLLSPLSKAVNKAAIFEYVREDSKESSNIYRCLLERVKRISKDVPVEAATTSKGLALLKDLVWSSAEDAENFYDEVTNLPTFLKLYGIGAGICESTSLAGLYKAKKEEFDMMGINVYRILNEGVTVNGEESNSGVVHS